MENRQLLASLAGEVWTDTNGNGFRDPQEAPAESVRVFLDENDDGQLNNGELFTNTDSLGQYVFDNLAAGTHVVRLEPGADEIQTSPRGFIGVGMQPQTVETQLFSMSPDGQVNLLGTPTTTPVDGIVRANSGQIFGLDSDADSLYTIDGITGAETLLATYSEDLAGGLAYDPVGDRLFAVGRPSVANNVWSLQLVDQTDGTLTPVGAGLPSLSEISGLTFDTPNNRVVGFDNASDRFFMFDTSGQGTMLAMTQRPLDASSLTAQGLSFVMFDNEDITGTALISVDPLTGEISNAFNSSQPLAISGLHFADRGDFPHRVTVADTDDLIGVDFGIRNVNDQLVNPLFDGFFLNEILISPRFGNAPQDQMIELRGPSGAILPDETYLVIVNDDFGGNNGEISTVIDLSDQSFGQNGFLTILPFASPHATDPDSNVLQSTGNNFADLPDGIFQGSASDIGGRTDPQTYFLVSTPTTPQVGMDIDTNNDAIVDGAAANWDVHDSVSMHPEVGRGSVAYGNVVYAESRSTPPNITVPPGSTLVPVEGFGYLARRGDSVGSDAEDWVAASIVNTAQIGQPVSYEIANGSLGVPNLTEFIGRDLDHFGDSNLVGGVRGTVIREANASDPNSLPQPAEGVTAYLDINNNEQLDNLLYRVNPDDFPVGTNVTNAYPGVTLTSTSEGSGFTGLEIEPALENFVFSSNLVFSTEGIASTSDFRKVRAEFYRPVNSVSAVVIANASTFTETYMRLDAFDVDGNLLDSILSGPLFGSQRQILPLVFPTDVVDYIEVYSDDDVTDQFGNPIFSLDGIVDTITYRQFEPNEKTDAQGAYEIENVVPDNYTVRFEAPTPLDPMAPPMVLIGAQGVPISVTKHENFILNPNLLPFADDLDFNLDENTPIGTILGAINGIDPDGSPVTYQINAPNSTISVDSDTGLITVSDLLDFETAPIQAIPVTVSDVLGGEFIVTVNITLNDLNEAPLVSNPLIQVPENTENGTAIGQVMAVDPDIQQNQTLTYTIIGGSGLGAIIIDQGTGLLTVGDEAALNFESNQSLTLTVHVADDGDPLLSTTVTQVIDLIDQNDSPQLVTSTMFVNENSSVIGNLAATDPDANQSLRYLISGGADESLFNVSNSGTVTTAPGVNLDFEDRDTYNIEVTVIDNGSPPLSDTGSVTIRVFDVNEPAVIDQTQLMISEDDAPGTIVSQLTLSDPENAPENYRLRLTTQFDADNYTFDDTNNILRVAANAQFDFESRPIEELLFEIIDDVELTQTATQSIQISIQDANDEPSILTTEIIVSEDAPAENGVGIIDVSDPDDGDQVTLEIIGGTAQNLFTVDSDSHVISVAADVELDFETMSGLNLQVRATDQSNASVEQIVAIQLNDVNEPPTINPNLVVPQAATGDFFVLRIPENQVIDQDGSPFELTIIDDQGGLPPWLEYNTATQTLSGLPAPGQEGTYQLTLRAFEFGPLQLFSELDFTIDVQVGSTAYTNGRDIYDVDNNRQVAALDALRVINWIGRNGIDQPPTIQPFFSGFVDVNGDLFVSALDALLVINELSNRGGESEYVEALALGQFVFADDSDETNDEALLSILGDAGLF